MINLNIYKSLNKITKYIDDNLEEEIDYTTIAKIMGVNIYTMKRIFLLLTNISLSEYIRKRRLTNAGFDLSSSKLKIIDVAIKYQYDNATSFSRAFTKFHGIKPSKVHKNSKLKNFPRIIFDEKIKEIQEIDYQIIDLDELILYGVGIKTNNTKISKDAPQFFDTIESKYLDNQGKPKYGMVTYKSDERRDCDYYYVLYDTKIKKGHKITIPPSKWLMFRINSQQAQDIQDMSHKFYCEFLPSCKYNLREIPELEYYHDDVTDFLVPIY